MAAELLVAELERTWRLTRRYPTELLSGLVLMIAGFYAFFLGARYIAGPAAQFGAELDSLVLGYCLWSLVLFAVNGLAGGLQQEALTGTLEQLFLSPYGAGRVLFARMLASLTIQLASAVLMLWILQMTTGRSLSLSPLLLLPLAAVLLGAYGIGLTLAALALVAKRVQQLLGLVQIVLLFLVVTPAETLGGSVAELAPWLPVLPGAVLLRDLMIRDLPLAAGPFLRTLAGGCVYLLLGSLAFRAAVRTARRRGLLGQH